MNKSDSINELAMALAKAQGQMRAAVKDASNPFFKSKYADLASVVDAIKTPLSSNGLSYVQFVGSDAEAHYVETMLIHSSGQYLSERVKIVVAKPNDPQSFGSAVTYFRRYSLQAVCGVPADDDDGNAATGKPGVHRPSDGAEDRIDEKTKNRMTDVANVVEDHMKRGDARAALDEWNKNGSNADADAKVYAWSLLDSKTRSTLKKMSEQQKAAA